MSTEAEPENVYELVGGEQWFQDLCTRFYVKVAEDENLRKLYPSDLEPSRYWLAMFLVQYWGGPAQYSDTRGHPRLRMRHMHLEVGIKERDLWFRHMRASLLEANLEVDLEKKMLDYFQMAADHLINSD